MKSTRWRQLGALLALALAAGCTKSSTDTSAATPPAPSPNEARAADPAAPGSAHAQATVPEAHSDVPPGERATPTDGAKPVAGADLVAIGGEREKVFPAAGGATAAESESYILKLAAPATVAKGAEGVVTLEIQPKKGWHLNKEYPTKLSVTPPAGVTLKKAEQVLADATSWTEQSGVFNISFNATAAGSKAFAGKLKFAVCTETTCDPKKETLAWTVAVE
jgi:hypothetical protein